MAWDFEASRLNIHHMIIDLSITDSEVVIAHALNEESIKIQRQEYIASLQSMTKKTKKKFEPVYLYHFNSYGT
jgi:hypothetical protein